jgi:hypothetical protein
VIPPSSDADEGENEIRDAGEMGGGANKYDAEVCFPMNENDMLA